jgi:hypothetical protein
MRSPNATDLRYFKAVSDGLLNRETWGLIAAVLGNAQNRSAFRQGFWWDSELGLSTYLAHASGTPQIVDVLNERGEIIGQRPPLIVTQEDPPRDTRDALQRWQRARRVFRATLERSRDARQDLQAVHQFQMSMPSLTRDLEDLTHRLASAKDSHRRAVDQHLAAALNCEDREAAFSAAQRAWQDHTRSRPGFFSRLFRTTRHKIWVARELVLHRYFDHTKIIAAEAASLKTRATSLLSTTNDNLKAAEAAHAEAASKHQRAIETLASWRRRLGPRFIDDAFADREHADRHQIAPWFDDETHRLCDDVFVAAVSLHKAFIDAAAKPLRHNLGVLMNIFNGRNLPDAAKEALIPDLWSSLFLVVPAVSTTFASVERMLGRLPLGSLGWLLIDEAGQALPQAAIGALMRTRRAVVVSDPMQIEPIVTLPEGLTQAICRTFGVDPDRFNAPNASVQTLADAASPVMAEFAGRQGSRTVGLPLLVHRRCANPMFGVSNAIAYQRLMVHSTPSRTSRIRDVLGPSRWLNMQGSANDKWCPEEGDTVLKLLQELQLLAPPDLYIVTPFVIVQDNLRKLVRDSGVVENWADDPNAWVRERIGTVHTVQGREAEAVIFVLEAPSAQQIGARNWAGAQPNLLNVAVTRAKEASMSWGTARSGSRLGSFASWTLVCLREMLIGLGSPRRSARFDLPRDGGGTLWRRIAREGLPSSSQAKAFRILTSRDSFAIIYVLWSPSLNCPWGRAW